MVFQFFQQQSDYISFLYGLAFILLATVCFVMSRDEGRHLSWIWLAGFGLTHGVYEWLAILPLGDSPAFAAVRLVLMTVSFVLLFEFGRDGLRRLTASKGESLGQWVYIPLLVSLAVALPFGMAALNVAARYSFGFTGSLLAAWTLFQLSKIRRVNPLNHWSLITAAILLVIYGMASGLIGPKAPFLRASLVNETSFMGVVGVPIQVVRGFLAIGLAGALWAYYLHTSRTALPEMKQAGGFNFDGQIVLALLFVLAAGWLFTDLLGQSADQSTRGDILNLAKVAGASLDHDEVTQLNGQPGDVNLPEYTSLRRQLIEINQATSHIRWLYLLTQKEGRILFTVDSIASGDPKHAGPGLPYQQPPQQLFSVFATGQPEVVGPYTIGDFSYISAFVPLRSPSTGQVMQVFEADINAADWQLAVSKARLAGIGISLLISLILVGFFIVRQRMAFSARQIEASEKRLSGAQKLAHIGSWSYLPELDQMTWSEEMFRIFGINAKNGAPAYPDLHRYFHPRDWAKFNTLNQAAIQPGGSGYELEMRVIRPDGNMRYVTVRAEVQRASNGAGPVQILGTQQDLTESKKAEEEMAEWKNRYDLVIASARQLVYENDLDSGSMIWGSSLLDVLGYLPDEMQGGVDRWTALIHPEDRSDAIWTWARAKATMAGYDTQYRILHKDGSFRWMQDRGDFVSFGSSNSTHMMGVLQDISERKQAEEALAIAHVELETANRELQKASLVKSQFLANMSHEIRTPLNAVIGMTGLLLDTELNAEQRDFAGTIRSSGEVLLALINDILDFSKIEAQKMDLENQSFELRRCLEEALDLIAPRAAEKKLELACSLEEDLPRFVFGDVTRLRQILVNLLSNAVKFTNEGEVVVSVSGQLVEGDRYQLHFAVHDTGIGIPPDRIGRLFQSFSQVDSSTTRRFGGTGLGLAISKRLCELMGGTVWVESSGEAGQGSTFHFTILAEAAPDQKVVDAAAGDAVVDLVEKNLLIVDDNATNRQILLRQAQSWGMHASAVASGPEALALIHQGAVFDAAVLDYQMPGMDGVSLASAIRKEDAGQALPLVLLSSLGYRDILKNNLDFAAFMTKPAKASLLYNTLVEAIVHTGVLVKRFADSQPQFDRHMGQLHPLRILVAEDNAVNQKVALSLLDRIGYRADVVANGQEAVDALLRQPYDVVLMDGQMPEMDGIEATRLIRREIPADRQPHIVAMTADALQGDRERYLASGMNDYISKPIRLEDLVRVLTHEALPQGAHPPVDAPAAAPPPEALEPVAAGTNVERINHAVLDEFRDLMGDEGAQMVAGLVTLYLKDTALLIQDMRQAVECANVDDLRRAAHTLKGNSSQVGATYLSSLCFDLEQAAKAGSPPDGIKMIEAIQAEFALVKDALFLM
jgi:PAS domain S-box-containing protein